MKRSNFNKKLLVSHLNLFILSCLILIIFPISFIVGCGIIDSTIANSGEIISDLEDEENETGDTQNNSNNENNTENNADIESDNELDENVSPEDTEQSEIEESEDSDSKLTINVYYADEQGEYLIGESRTVSPDSRYVDALYELMKLPVNENLFRLIPDTTVINSVTVSDGEAVVDMSKNFVEDRFDSDTTDILLVYSVVNTLTEFSEVQSVTFHINGQKLDLLGMLDISSPIYRRDDLIK